MLLFIDGIDPEQIQKDHFKTSHVIVYPLPELPAFLFFCISKHLMLLFIQERKKGVFKSYEFQNISCYCLSSSRAEYISRNCISKHLMLLFIFTTQYEAHRGI